MALDDLQKCIIIFIFKYTTLNLPTGYEFVTCMKFINQKAY